MAMTRFIRYRIEPREAGLFTQDTQWWAQIIPQCGGDLIGYFSPHPGSAL
ncbi:NIPSNAP family protein [Aeromonas bivalvium]